MTDYRSYKVPDLKKLLGERNLSTAGNKPDLIARLQESDDKRPSNSARAAEDEIDYSDDDLSPDPLPTIPGKGVTATGSSVNSTAKVATTAASTKLDVSQDKSGSLQSVATKHLHAPVDAETSDGFALKLPATSGEEETRKRLERAKRFGVVGDDETQKRLERAQKFGLVSDTLIGLDDSLPERPLKRGRNREGKAENDNLATKRRFMERPGRVQGKDRVAGVRGAQSPRERKTRGRAEARPGADSKASSDRIKMEARKRRFAES